MTTLHPNLEHYVVTTHELVRHEVRVLAPNQRVANAKAVNGEGLVTRLPQSMCTLVVSEDSVVQNIMMLEQALSNLAEMCEADEDINSRIGKEYPFFQCLTDMFCDVVVWREAQEKTKPLATLLTQEEG